MAETLSDAVERIQAAHAADLRRARDESRTDEWRRQALAKIYVEMKAEVDAARDKISEDTRERTLALTRRAFGTVGLPGDPASLAISHRDAVDRVAQVDDPRELQGLLDKADRSGDEVLARAIAERAYEANWAEVANAFLATRPMLRDDLNELWLSGDRGGASLQARLFGEFSVEAIRPQELYGMADYAIQELARADTAPAAVG